SSGASWAASECSLVLVLTVADGDGPLFEERNDLTQHLGGDAFRNCLEPLSSPCAQIESARLVAAHDAGGTRASTHKRYRKPGRSDESPAGRDRQHNGNAG